MKRKILILIATITFAVIITTGFVFAERDNTNPYMRAEQLNQLGLLKGVSRGNYDMTRAPTRAESVVMLIRLLGKESEALRFTASGSPFIDVPAWAEKYVAYAYETGLTKGISDHRFGSGMAVSPEQYTTFLLRALNYEDEIDFTYEDAMDFAADIGLLEGWNYSGKFLRSDMIILSFLALVSDFNGQSGTLAEFLLKSGVFTAAQWEKAWALGEMVIVSRNDFEWEAIKHISPSSKSAFFWLLRDAMKTAPDFIYVYVPHGQEREYLNYFDSIFSHLSEYSREYYWHGLWAGVFAIEPTYTPGFLSLSYLQNLTVPVKDDIKTLARKGFDIYRSEFANISAEYDMIKGVHDYVVRSLYYDTKMEPASADLDGALNNGKATCSGYSAMFSFFLGIKGIETETVIGTATNQRETGSHAWSKVKLGGSWYNVDVAWDDPYPEPNSNEVSYNYFLLSDDVLSKSHKWDRNYYTPSPNSLN